MSQAQVSDEFSNKCLDCVCDVFVTVTQYCRASCLTNIYILITDVLDVLEKKNNNNNSDVMLYVLLIALNVCNVRQQLFIRTK